MSTRATYQFKRQYGRDVTVYIHHDGYPEGAAGLYLLPAIEKANGHLSAEAFIRANDRAEITDSHGVHGDTEWRYTIDPSKGAICAEHRPIGYGHDGNRWFKKFDGALADFVNRYAGEFRPGVTIRERGAGRWLTAEMAQAEADVKAAAAKEYRAKFPQWTGNADAADREAAEAAGFAAGFEPAKEAS